MHATRPRPRFACAQSALSYPPASFFFLRRRGHLYQQPRRGARCRTHHTTTPHHTPQTHSSACLIPPLPFAPSCATLRSSAFRPPAKRRETAFRARKPAVPNACAGLAAHQGLELGSNGGLVHARNSDLLLNALGCKHAEPTSRQVSAGRESVSTDLPRVRPRPAPHPPGPLTAEN